MQFCHVQGFIRINVAKPRQKGLVEKQRLELAMTATEIFMKPLRCEFIAKGFGTKFT
jgi:hypothetical protein